MGLIVQVIHHVANGKEYAMIWLATVIVIPDYSVEETIVKLLLAESGPLLIAALKDNVNIQSI